MPGWSKLSRHARGYGALWAKKRAVVLKLIDGKPSALCAVCRSKGRPTPATQCDHIKPKSQGGSDDFDNLQPICTSCHSEKSLGEAAQAQGRTLKQRPTFTADGKPIW